MRLLVFLLGFLLCQNALAQDIVYSEPVPFDFQNGDFSVVGKVESHIYTYRATSKGYFLEALNDQMQLEYRIHLDFFPDKIYETKFIIRDNQIIVLYQGVENKVLTQYAALLDKNARLIKGPVKIVDTKIGLFGKNKDRFSSVISQDKNVMAVYEAQFTDEGLLVHATWMSGQLEKLGQSSVIFKDAQTDEMATVTLFNSAQLFLSFNDNKKGNPDNGFDFLQMVPQSNTPVFFNFNLNGKFAGDYYTKADEENGRLYIGGLFSDSKKGNPSGLLFSYLNLSTKTFEHQRFYNFDQTLQNSGSGRFHKKFFNDFKIKQMVVKNDGGFVLMAEKFFVNSRLQGGGGFNSYYGNPMMSRSTREYNYGDIFIISINSEGQKDWHQFIQKDQVTYEDGGVFSSFGLFNTGSELAFLYNDFRNRAASIVVSTINGDGKTDQMVINTVGNREPNWLPRSSQQISNKTIIVPCIKGSKINFAKVSF